MVGSVQDPTKLPLFSWQLLLVVLQSAASIWCSVLQRWLLIAVTLERLSLEEGFVLARTCSPKVRRQPAELTLGCPVTASDEVPSIATLGVSILSDDDSIGTIINPWGRREMHEGSSPLMASWMESTSMVV